MDDRTVRSLSSGRGICVYGYRVRSLTLRHMLGLMKIESPYMTGGEPDDMDVLLAARILSTRDDEGWWSALGAGSWWERFCGLFKGLRYGRMDRRARERAKLEAWLDAETLVPQILPTKAGKKLRIPWMLGLLASIMRECGCTMDQAWWMRFSDVAWAKVAWQEQDGGEFVLLDDKLISEYKEMGYTDKDLGIGGNDDE